MDLKENATILLKQILKYSFDEIFITDAKGNIIYTRPSTEKLFGIPYEEMIHQNVYRLEEEGVFSPSAICFKRKREKTRKESRSFFSSIKYRIAQINEIGRGGRSLVLDNAIGTRDHTPRPLNYLVDCKCCLFLLNILKIIGIFIDLSFKSNYYLNISTNII